MTTRSEVGTASSEKGDQRRSQTYLHHTADEGYSDRCEVADLDGEVDVVVAHVIAEVHASAGLRHAHHALDVSDGDRDATRDGRLFAEVRIQ